MPDSVEPGERYIVLQDVADWLGTGLQSPLIGFDSRRRLNCPDIFRCPVYVSAGSVVVCRLVFRTRSDVRRTK